MKHLIKAAVVAAMVFFTGSVTMAQQKLGHLNTQEIYQYLPDVKTATDAYQAFAKTKQDELEQMGAEARKKYAAFQEKQQSRSEANKATVDPELQAMDTELTGLQTRIQEAQQKAQQDVQQKQQELFLPIQTKIDNAIKAVAKEKGYTYVFDSASPEVKYFEGGDDLLADVKTKLGIAANAKPVITPQGSGAGASPTSK
ncbi:periplasmic chaperone for outer membrane proteins Skp [bacterium A37T11]|nr:periplasmic chaperone for outer membrane proteins Skp [bacterium A37T11]